MNRALLACALLGAITAPRVPAQLGGTRTIDGGGGGDYVSVVAAVADLNAQGVAPGGVTFRIRAGTYTGAVTITATGGPTDPIVFEAAAGETVVVQASAGTAVFLLSGCDGVALRDLTIRGSGIDGVRLTAAAVSASLERCRIEVSGGSRMGIYAAGWGNDGLTLDRCDVVGSAGADYGLRLESASGPTLDWRLTNNWIRGFDREAVRLIGRSSAPLTGEALHNTIRIDAAGGIDVVQQYSRVVWRNNVYAHFGPSGYCFYQSSGQGWLDSESNCFFRTGAAIGYRSGVQTVLADWQAASGQDLTSISADPRFVSPTDLHLADDSPCQDRGQAGLGVGVDLDGQARSVTPDLGADENPNAPPPAPPLAGVYDVGGPTPEFASVVEAVEALDLRGQAGPVTFDVHDGAYPARFGIGSVAGNGPGSGIVLRRAPAAVGPVTLGTFRLHQVDHVTIEGFDRISGTGNVVLLTGVVTDATIRGCRIEVAGAGASGVYATVGCDRLSIERCEIVGSAGADYGVRLESSTGPTTGLRLVNNIVRGCDVQAFRLVGRSSAPLLGVAYHNTLRIDSGSGICAYQYYSRVEWRNNVYTHLGTGGYCFYQSSGTGWLDSNWNCFDHPAAVSAGYYAGVRPTLAEWQAGSGRDLSGIERDPLFVGPTDLHIGDESPCQDRGASGLGVGVDFDGEPRAAIPDLGADENAALPTVLGPLAGLYDVGGGSLDYPTLLAATRDLVVRGQSGPVTFALFAGSYPAAIGIGPVAGNGPTAPITIRPAAAAGGPVSTGRFYLYQVDHVSLEDIDSISSSGLDTVVLVGQTVGCRLVRCLISVSGASRSAVYSGPANHDLTIDACQIVGGGGADYGIRLESQSQLQTGVSLSNNVVRGFDVMGMRVMGRPGQGMTGVAHHNTVQMSSGGSCVYSYYSRLEWRNNIYAHLGGPGSGYCFQVAGTTSWLDSDYNCFFRPGGAHTGYYGAVRATLADWRAGSGRDASGIDGDPKFVSPTDLHIGDESLCQGRAQPGLLAVDRDGDPRAATPDIGADENAAVPAALGPMAGIYDVGGGVLDYANLREAFEDLQRRGQSAPVVFDVYRVDFGAKLGLVGVAGNSLANTITIRKAAAAPGPVTSKGFTFFGVDGLTLEGFDQVEGAGDHAIYLVGGALSFTLRRTRVVARGNGIAGLLSGAGNHDATIEQNEFVGASGANYGIYLSSAGGATTGWKIHNNAIRGFDDRSIQIIGRSTAPVTGTAYHNTVWMDRGLTCVLQQYSQLVWRNNVLAHVGTSGSSYCFYQSSGPQWLDSNYNCLYRPGTASTGYYSGVRETIVDWQVYSGQDRDSIPGDPGFVGPTDLRLVDASRCQGRGLAGLGVATDRDGEARAATPDLGSDENTNAPTTPGPMSGVLDVGGGALHYPNLRLGVDDLLTRGQDGPVEFRVFGGVHPGKVGIGRVAGNGPTRPIAVRKALGTSAVTTGGFIMAWSGSITIEDLDSVRHNGNGLEVRAIPGLVVRRCNVTARGSGMAGLYSTAGSDGLVLEAVRFIGEAGADYGIRLESGGGPTTGWRIVNCVVRGFDNQGVRLIGVPGAGVEGVALHNSIRMDVGLACVSEYSARFVWRNNVLAHHGTSSGYYCWFIGRDGPMHDSDSNALFRPNGARTGYSVGTSYDTLVEWQLQAGHDLSSTPGDPRHVGPTDLHIGDDSRCHGRGLAGLGVAIDIDGQPRATPPDLGADENSNAPTAGPLSGRYDVGGGAGHYPNIAWAAEDLLARGQSGPVAFDLFAGSHPGKVAIGQVAGNDATNTIEIVKAAAAGGAVTTRGIVVGWADHVTVADIDSIAEYGYAVELRGGATSISILRSTITSTRSGYAGILSTAGNHDLLVEGCQLVGTGGSNYGIRIESAAAATTGLLLVNNFIRGFDSQGLRIRGGAGGAVSGQAYHNTVRLDAGQACVYQDYSQVVWRNNLLANFVNSTGSVCFYQGPGEGWLDSDSNGFHHPLNARAGYFLGWRWTLASWQAATGDDLRSVEADPLFAGPTDPHLLPGSGMIDGGRILLEVVDDLEGDPRPRGCGPDLGADESPGPPTFIGTVRAADGVTPLVGVTLEVAMLLDGVEVSRRSVQPEDALFGVCGPVVAGSLLTIHLEEHAFYRAALVTRTDGATNLYDLDLVVDRLVLRTDHPGVWTNEELDRANDGDADLQDLYADGGGTSLVVGAATLDVRADYSPGGSVDGHRFLLRDGATVDPGSGTLAFDGDWDDTGGSFVATAGRVRLDGAAPQRLSTGAGNSFHDLAVDGVDVRTDPARPDQAVVVGGQLDVGGLLGLSGGQELRLTRSSASFPPGRHTISGTLELAGGDGTRTTTVAVGDRQQLVVGGTLRVVPTGTLTFLTDRFVRFTRSGPFGGYSIHLIDGSSAWLEYVRFEYLLTRSPTSDELTEATVESGLTFSGAAPGLVRFRNLWFTDGVDGGAPPGNRYPRYLQFLVDDGDDLDGLGGLEVLRKLRFEGGSAASLRNAEIRAPGDTIRLANGSGPVHGERRDADGLLDDNLTADPDPRNGGEGVVVFEEGPTSVTMVAVGATAYDGAVLVEWETGQEVDNLGFNVYRSLQADRGWVRVNPRLIVGLGDSVTGGRYYFLDSQVANDTTYHYLVEDVDLSGGRSLHGPVDATPRAGLGIPAPDDADYVAWGRSDDAAQTVGDTEPFDPPDSSGAGSRDLALRLLGVDLLAAGIRLLSWDESGAVIEVLPPEPVLTPEDRGGRTEVRIEMAGYGSTDDDGQPIVPTKGVLLETPEIERAEIRILEVEYETRTGLIVVRSGEAPRPVATTGRTTTVDAPAPTEDVEEEPVLPGDVNRWVRYQQRRLQAMVVQKRCELLCARRKARYRLLGQEPPFCDCDCCRPEAAPVPGTTTVESPAPDPVDPSAIYPDALADLGGLSDYGGRQLLPIEIRPVQVTGGGIRVDIYRRILIRIDFIGRRIRPVVDGSVEQFRLAADGRAVKVRIDRPGLYRLDRAELVAAGFDVSVDPTTLRLFHLGREVAIEVEGEDDGVLDPGDGIVFIGQGNPWPLAHHPVATRYTDQDVYWLVADAGVEGLRMASIETPPGAPGLAAPDLAAVAHVETDGVYHPGLADGDGRDHWFDPVPLYNPAGGSDPRRLRTVVVSTPDLADRPFIARLEVALAGLTDPAAAPDHHVLVRVGGFAVGEAVWDGPAGYQAVFEFPSALLTAGDNVVELELPADLPGIADDSVLLDYVRLAYRRRPTADGDRLAFDGDLPGLFEIGGFGSDDVAVVDVSDPDRPARLTGLAVAGGTVRFDDRQTAARGRYVLRERTAYDAVLAVEANLPSTLNDPARAIDWVAIAPADLLAGLAPLAGHRSGQGLRTLTADLVDVFDEFSFGIPDPVAIRDFLAWARASWAVGPRFALLVGDGSYDSHGRLAVGGDRMPTYMRQMDHLWSASDAWYAAVEGDDELPDLALGRLPVSTGGQLGQVVGKILTHESAAVAPWHRMVTLVADDDDDVFDFTLAGRLAAAAIDPAFTVESLEMATLDPATTRTRIADAFTDGRLLIGYLGHGDVERWAAENVLDPPAVGALPAGDRQGLVLALDCLNGAFHLPGTDGLGEVLVRADRRGAIAFWGSTTLSTPNLQERAYRELVAILLVPGPAPTIGEAIEDAVVRAWIDGAESTDLLRGWVLLGDPATRLR